MIQSELFSDRASASEAAAELLEDALRTQLEISDSAALVVSGGSTPKDCYASLSDSDLPWDRVQITLTDERCVASNHPDSNERMLREYLMVGAAAAASFVPLDSAPEQDESFAAVLVGMGVDGHFASIFPDADCLDGCLDLRQKQPALEVRTAGSPHSRMTMPLARLLKTNCIVLLVFGDDKLRIIESPAGLPIAHLLEQERVPVQVLWAP